MWDLQRIVYAIEVGGLRKFLVGGAALAVMLGLAVYYSVTQFNGLSSAEAMDQAQLARNLSQGQGFSTQVVRPLAIWQMKGRGIADKELNLTQFPDTVNPPAYPMALALIFKVFSPKFFVPAEEVKNFQYLDGERYMQVFGIACALMTGVLLFVWVLRTFDLLAAAVSVILFMLTDLLWQLTTSGLGSTWGMMWVTALGLVIGEALLAEESEKDWLAVLWMGVAGVISSILILTKYSFLWMLPPAFVLIFFSFRKRWIILPLFAGAVLLCTGWWWLRNIQVSGNPFGLAWANLFVNAGRFPGDSLWRTLVVEPGTLNFKGAVRSLIYGLSGQIGILSSLCGGFIILGLVTGSAFHLFRSFVASRSRWFWIGSIVAVIMASSPSFRVDSPELWNESNVVALFLPVFLCFGTAFLLVLLDRIQFPIRLIKYLLIGAVCLIQAIPVVLTIAREAPKFPYPPYFPPVLVYTASWVGENELQMSDIPWASAWNQGRSTVWLPMKKEDFYSINDLIQPIRSILLTPYSSNRLYYSQIKSGEYEAWAGLVTRSDFNKPPLPVLIPLWPRDKGDYFILMDKQPPQM